MAYRFYKTQKINGKYTLKEFFNEFMEISAINKLNEIFNSEVSRLFKSGKKIEDCLDYIFWRYSIKDSYNDYDLLPEWFEYMISENFDSESDEIKKILEKILNKHYIKEKKHYYRKNIQYTK